MASRVNLNLLLISEHICYFFEFFDSNDLLVGIDQVIPVFSQHLVLRNYTLNKLGNGRSFFRFREELDHTCIVLIFSLSVSIVKSCQSIVVEDISAHLFDHSEILFQLRQALFLELVHHDLVAQFHEYVVVHDIGHFVVSWDLEHLDQAPFELLIRRIDNFLLFI